MNEDEFAAAAVDVLDGQPVEGRLERIERSRFLLDRSDSEQLALADRPLDRFALILQILSFSKTRRRFLIPIQYLSGSFPFSIKAIFLATIDKSFIIHKELY